MADLVNSIIIIKFIGFKFVITLVIVTILKCIGSMYYRSKKAKKTFVIIHGLSVGIIESIMLIILGIVKSD